MVKKDIYATIASYMPKDQKNSKEYLTKEKFEALTRELEQLRTSGRKKAADNLEYARSLGDISENAEYQEARTAQVEIEERILKLENILKNADIVTIHHAESVDVGTIVVVQKEGNGNKVCYQIVGSEEANTKEGKISNRSPLGEAMIGKREGETFSFKTPKGITEYKIVDIE